MAFLNLKKLWSHVVQERTTEKLCTNYPDNIERLAGYTGERGFFVEILLSLKLLYVVNDEYVVHDWTTHNEYASKSEERSVAGRRAADARWSQEQKNNKSKGGMRPASNAQCLLNSIYKKENTLSEPSPGLRLGELLFGLIQTRDPKAQPPNMERWAVEIERIIRLDGRTAEEVEAVIRWAHNDPFWAGVILSPRGLRDKFTQIVLKMGGPVSIEQSSGEGGTTREAWKSRKSNCKRQDEMSCDEDKYLPP